MAVLRFCVLLVVVCVTGGHSKTSKDSFCSYTFKVPATECGPNTIDDRFMKSSMIALQTQMKLIAAKHTEDIRKLTEENQKLRKKIETGKASNVLGRNRSVVNVKQCSKRGLNDHREYGLLFSCDFFKKREDTVLRVVWNGDIRLVDTGPKAGSARRWFFTINGKECSDPSTIDTQLYIRDSNSNTHRPAYVEGYCRGILAGDVYVAWNVGDVMAGEGYDQSKYNTGGSYTGWVATVRIIVEEVDVESSDTAIV
ncbi:hypothetical protein NP493_1601g00021 [Ridgeia piscesae]|uniref:CTHRC1 C-terminal domain-containing protein n=1 Tax=Ridgeia piscesae TaxID=27915 RepID=A0AAD9NA65_RIDPI|nr:hypothetical protein NP493_1601g00021 [Ridgeia piscesae]